MTIADAFEPFLSFCQSERHVSTSTLAKYQDCFDSWLQPTIGKQQVSAVTRLQVLKLRQSMVDRHLSVARQYSIIMCLKSLLNSPGQRSACRA